MKARDELRILLLQIRDQPRVRQEEHESFLRYAGVDATQLEVLNVFDTPEFSEKVVAGFDALLVGGASEASVMEPGHYPFVNPGMRLLLHCIDIGLPVFASCFGFQLAVAALGGGLVKDQRDFEMGTISIQLSEAAASDTLLHDTPNGFSAVAVHRERTTQAPPGTTQLAYTPACCHAFRVDHRPFWAFQFHPEVDRATLVERLTIFKDNYTDDDAHLDEILAAANETPESNVLVRKFIDRVLLSPGGEGTAPATLPR